MRRCLAIAAGVILILALLPWGVQTQTRAANKEKIQIVTTIFPEYDWVLEVLGDAADRAEITLLMDKGVDLHSFQPSAEDIMKVTTCDLFVYVGGASDDWAEDVLATAVNPDMQVIDLLETLGDAVKEEKLVEGMEAEEEDAEDIEFDEHVWLSLKDAEILVQSIADTLSAMDPDMAETYAANAAGYLNKLDELDERYEAAINAAEKDTLLFGDRFPFRYLTDDYGLNYFAAFAGCSAETEASFETIVFLAGKLNELGLSSVLTIDGSDQKIAQTIVENTKTRDQKILVLDSMQSTSLQDYEKGVTYLSIMEQNLHVLTEALEMV